MGKAADPPSSPPPPAPAQRQTYRQQLALIVGLLEQCNQIPDMTFKALPPLPPPRKDREE